MDVHIRPCRLDDAEAVAEAVHESRARLEAWTPWCRPGYSLTDARAFLELQVPAFDHRTEFTFAIVDRNGRFLGACGLNQIDQANHRANLGYWVRTSATRQGVATTAVRQLRDWAFQNTELVRLEIVVAVGNVPSHRVAEKAGAVREGTLRQRLFLHGTARDATVFSLIRLQTFGLRRATPGDEPLLREVRLKAMAEDPEAFGSTYERELARTVADWQRWMSPGVTFILDHPDGANGLVAGARDAADPSVVHLMAMWVHPALRGAGAADALVQAVAAWAESEGATMVRLDVIESNDRARRFYQRLGFHATGHRAIRERDGLIELRMECPVGRSTQERG